MSSCGTPGNRMEDSHLIISWSHGDARRDSFAERSGVAAAPANGWSRFLFMHFLSSAVIHS